MAQKKRGLGRGLDALIESRSDSADPGRVAELDLDWIEPNPVQPRAEMDPEELEALSQSIREHGVIQPVIVTESDGTTPYQLIAGERRWRAARQAGLSVIPAIIRESSPRAMLEIALIENIQRADLNVLEEAAAYRQLIEDFGLKHGDLADRVGKNRSTITNALRILQCPEEVQQALMAGTITEGHARALLGLPSSVDQIAGLELVLNRQLTVRQTERMVREWNEGRTDSTVRSSAELPKDPNVQDFERRLQRSLGTRVELKRGRKGGRLVIHYYSDEELNTLSERLLDEDDF
ncbi:MAG: ParB/RepB/Spo0J family partition protein [Sphaerobacteraceae bacterium]|nr:MAG: ParB/RepB/Spo0J family partition protein [Sphaerobacteraceae bacterium]